MIARHLVRILDSLWINHLENLQSLKESVNIRAYAQHEPIVEYRREAYQMYQLLKQNFEALLSEQFFRFLKLNLKKSMTSLKRKTTNRKWPGIPAKKLNRAELQKEKK